MPEGLMVGIILPTFGMELTGLNLMIKQLQKLIKNRWGSMEIQFKNLQ